MGLLLMVIGVTVIVQIEFRVKEQIFTPKIQNKFDKDTVHILIVLKFL